MNRGKKIVGVVLAALLASTAATAREEAEAQAELSAVSGDEHVSILYKKEEATQAWYVPNFTWSDVNVNYLDWSGRTERINDGDQYADFWYAELEGGAGWDWGDFYFFTDLENPGRGFDADEAPDDSRWVIKPVLDINIPGTEGLLKNVQLHIQDYYLYGDTFLVNNLVVGLAYKFLTNNFFARPFVGVHYMHDSFHESMWNGYMGGWVFNYDIHLMEQKFALSNWHEFEWERDESTYLNPDGSRQEFGDRSSWGVQGALAAWWHATKHVSAGVQYRYAYKKLGQDGYIHGWIYTLKYNF